jgi:hypothetical protein
MSESEERERARLTSADSKLLERHFLHALTKDMKKKRREAMKKQSKHSGTTKEQAKNTDRQTRKRSM